MKKSKIAVPGKLKMQSFFPDWDPKLNEDMMKIFGRARLQSSRSGLRTRRRVVKNRARSEGRPGCGCYDYSRRND